MHSVEENRETEHAMCKCSALQAGRQALGLLLQKNPITGQD